jgi:hypothetical protein
MARGGGMSSCSWLERSPVLQEVFNVWQPFVPAPLWFYAEGVEPGGQELDQLIDGVNLTQGLQQGEWLCCSNMLAPSSRLIMMMLMRRMRYLADHPEEPDALAGPHLEPHQVEGLQHRVEEGWDIQVPLEWHASGRCPRLPQNERGGWLERRRQLVLRQGLKGHICGRGLGLGMILGISHSWRGTSRGIRRERDDGPGRLVKLGVRRLQHGRPFSVRGSR